MQLFHFGDSASPLLGVYDPPARDERTRGGVVVCAPFGHEYVRAYRALRNLASSLADAGWHVLRFDYFGCGDSAGAARDSTVERWQQDVGTAIDELKDMAALTRVSVVGVRFGGALAAIAAGGRRDVDTLVLWDPVESGRTHLEKLRDLQRTWLNGRPRPRLPADWTPEAEVIGFPVSPRLEHGFAGADLCQLRTWRARRLVILNSSKEDAVHLRTHLGALSVPFVHEQVPGDCEWREPRSVHLTLLARDMAERIRSVLIETQAK